MLTKEEVVWVKKLQKLLTNPPSGRLGFYTIGDNVLHLYDKSKETEIYKHQLENECFFPVSVESCNADLGIILAKSQIHSVAG